MLGFFLANYVFAKIFNSNLVNIFVSREICQHIMSAASIQVYHGSKRNNFLSDCSLGE